MKRRPLGRTGLEVAPLALGTVKLGRRTGLKYPDSFELPDERTAARLLDIAEEAGMNLLDTAPAYGISEQRLGALLVGRRRRWLLSTKAGEQFDGERSLFDFRPAALRASVERSLHALRTDVIDLVLVHSDGRDVELIEHAEVFDTLASLVRAGWIRSFGMSSKTLEGGLATVAASDVVMVGYSVADRSMAPVIQEAAVRGKGVLIKKALASGHLCVPGGPPLESTFNELLRMPGVSSVVIGTSNPAHLLADITAACRALNLA